jgi:hypothetical protein
MRWTHNVESLHRQGIPHRCATASRSKACASARTGVADLRCPSPPICRPAPGHAPAAMMGAVAFQKDLGRGDTLLRACPPVDGRRPATTGSTTRRHDRLRGCHFNRLSLAAHGLGGSSGRVAGAAQGADPAAAASLDWLARIESRGSRIPSAAEAHWCASLPAQVPPLSEARHPRMAGHKTTTNPRAVHANVPDFEHARCADARCWDGVPDQHATRSWSAARDAEVVSVSYPRTPNTMTRPPAHRSLAPRLLHARPDCEPTVAQQDRALRRAIDGPIG